jgi:hypothetical protein
MKFLLFRINLYIRLINIIKNRRDNLMGKYLDQLYLAREEEAKQEKQND